MKSADRSRDGFFRRVPGAVRFGLFMLALVLALALESCTGARPGGTADLGSAGALRPIESRVVAIAGRTLVMPVAPTGKVDPAGRVATVELDDSRRLSGEVRRLYSSPGGGSPRWLAGARRWWAGSPKADDGSTSATPRAPTAPRANVETIWLDVLVVKLPTDAPGRAAKIEGQPVAFDWRRPPTGGSDVFAHSLTPAALASAKAKVGLLATLKPALNDPFFRWRARLLADRLRRAGYASLADRIDAVTFQSPAIEALAEQIELRARLGLERLASVDAMVARDFAEAITRIAAIGPDRVAPVWTPIGRGEDDSGLTALLASLLDQTIAGADLIGRVEAWLSTQPSAVGWVVDDAGLASPGQGVALCRMRIADLTGRGGVGVASLGDGEPGPRVSVPSLGSAAVVASSPLASAPRTASIRLGESWSMSAPIVAGAIEAKPPGVLVKAMQEPWSLGGWLVGGATLAPMDNQTAALLERKIDSGWELYLECRTPKASAPTGDASNPSPAGDVVRVWLGPAGKPRAVLRIDPAGYVIDELEQTDEGEEPARQPIVVRRLSDRWVCELPIPADAIEAGGFLRLGMERRNDAGARSTWPRPVLPWRQSPGRALIDLRHWHWMDLPADP